MADHHNFSVFIKRNVLIEYTVHADNEAHARRLAEAALKEHGDLDSFEDADNGFPIFESQGTTPDYEDEIESVEPYDATA